jgi:solute carrier family 25 (mitochondrial citrate transporter), member 1
VNTVLEVDFPDEPHKAGLGAGMTEAIIAVTPSETIKYAEVFTSSILILILWCPRTKMIDDAKRPNPQYRGLAHGTMSIIRQDGILGIYRGLFPVVSVHPASI